MRLRRLPCTVLVPWAALMLMAGSMTDRAAADLINPGFEDGLTGYSVEGSTTVTTDPASPPPTSSSIAGSASVESLLPGAGGSETDVSPSQGNLFALLTTDGVTATKLSQTFAAASSPLESLLQFDFRFMTDEIDDPLAGNDSMLVELADDQGTVLEHFAFSRDDLQPGGSGDLTPIAIRGVGNFVAGTDWLVGSIDLLPYLGQTLTVSFTVFDLNDDFVVSAVALDNLRLSAIPEPSSLALLSTGAGAVLVLLGRRRRTRARGA